MFRNRKWLLWVLPISLWKSTNIAIWVLVMHCLLIEQGAGMLTSTADSSSPTRSHALQQVKAARIGHELCFQEEKAWSRDVEACQTPSHWFCVALSWQFSVFSGNVTCFATSKSCSNRSHLSGCFKCSSLLACKAPRVQLSICFPSSLSRIHLAASLLCSAHCFQDILFEQAGNSHWNKLASCFQNILFDKTGNSLWKKVAFLQRIKWHNWSAGAWKYLTWCQ